MSIVARLFFNHKHAMKLTVPANYDLEVVPALARYPVTEVYGKLPGDLVGGGRPSYMGTPLGCARPGPLRGRASAAWDRLQLSVE